MKSLLSCLAGFSLAELSYALKVGIITDLHLHLRYDKTAQSLDECTKDIGEPTALEAHMGRY